MSLKESLNILFGVKWIKQASSIKSKTKQKLSWANNSYLFECEGLGFLFGAPGLPNTDGCAESSSNDQFGIGADRTQDLSPLRQTLIYYNCLWDERNTRALDN